MRPRPKTSRASPRVIQARELRARVRTPAPRTRTAQRASRRRARAARRPVASVAAPAVPSAPAAPTPVARAGLETPVSPAQCRGRPASSVSCHRRHHRTRIAQRASRQRARAVRLRVGSVAGPDVLSVPAAPPAVARAGSENRGSRARSPVHPVFSVSCPRLQGRRRPRHRRIQIVRRASCRERRAARLLAASVAAQAAHNAPVALPAVARERSANRACRVRLQGHPASSASCHHRHPRIRRAQRASSLARHAVRRPVASVAARAAHNVRVAPPTVARARSATRVSRARTRGPLASSCRSLTRGSEAPVQRRLFAVGDRLRYLSPRRYTQRGSTPVLEVGGAGGRESPKCTSAASGAVFICARFENTWALVAARRGRVCQSRRSAPV
jgi:hypothetical protein